MQFILRQNMLLHIFRKANRVANRLASHAMPVDVNFHVYSFVQNFIVSEVRADIAQIVFPRGF